MGHTATAHPITTSAGPVEPVPVAFLGRTSTAILQDPAASLQRQARQVQDSLPPGWFINAWYWDIESGGLDIEDRGHGQLHQGLDVGLPRDGGLAALLAEASGPEPRFAAVMCEDIERSGRDTFNALKLERQLADAGIPLFATDEPINVEGMNATTLLVRRVKQGVAEWYRYQLKDKAWRGFEQHTIDGYNIGAACYGYLADRMPHPNPSKAALGRTKSRLTLDPQRAPVVSQIYTWRTVDKLGVATITNRLNASPSRYPSPRPGGWNPSTVYAILGNPKYTGYMVYGRQRRTSRGKRPRNVPQDQWLWSPEPAHPAIISRATWDTAQDIGAEHASARDDAEPSTHPATRRTYLLRSRIRCRDCTRRMKGTLTRPDPHHPGYVYYDCPHNPKSPRHQAAAPDHPRTVRVREDALVQVIEEFFTTRIFGPDRAAFLAAQLPASATDQAAQCEQETAALNTRLHQIDTAENAHAREIEHLAGQPADSPAITALRSRIIARFSELETERTQINERLAVLARASSQQEDPALLAALPTLADLTGTPIRTEAQLFQAFGIELTYNKTTHQVTIHATITPATPHALAAIIATSEPPTTPSTPDLCHSPQDPRVSPLPQARQTLAAPGARDWGWWGCSGC